MHPSTKSDHEDDSVEILDDFPPCPNTEESSPAPLAQKKKRTSSSRKARAGPEFCGAGPKF